MKRTILSAPFLILSSVFLVYACGNSEEEAKAPGGPAQVAVVQLSKQPVKLYTDYPATLQGKEDIEIRPKIDGYIDAVLIDEGQNVHKGQLLFKISNPQYEQTMRNAAAAVEVAESDVENARLQYNKTKPLVEKGIVSSYELETARLTMKSKEAALLQARANLANAKVNVGYTTITSPFDGVVGTLPYKLGSYVSSATSSPLTVISNISKIYAYFSINEKEQLEFFRNAKGKSMQEKIAGLPEVTLILSDGTQYDQKGKVETFSGQVSSQTGSFNVRAGFQNPGSLLRSGNSGKVRIYSNLNQAILIPQNATYELQGKRFAYKVNADQTVSAVEITVREVPGGQYYVVDSGLKPGEQVAIDGVASLADGMKIIPQKTDAAVVFKLEEKN